MRINNADANLAAVFTRRPVRIGTLLAKSISRAAKQVNCIFERRCIEVLTVKRQMRRQVLDCASPLALWNGAKPNRTNASNGTPGTPFFSP
jgi:hypothetical protein